MRFTTLSRSLLRTRRISVGQDLTFVVLEALEKNGLERILLELLAEELICFV
jgi:hypothetical protein